MSVGLQNYRLQGMDRYRWRDPKIQLIPVNYMSPAKSSFECDLSRQLRVRTPARMYTHVELGRAPVRTRTRAGVHPHRCASERAVRPRGCVSTQVRTGANPIKSIQFRLDYYNSWTDYCILWLVTPGFCLRSRIPVRFFPTPVETFRWCTHGPVVQAPAWS
jgi:hypothetical protein